MHLLRVQVPDFRGLKNIDITFEKDFVPSIFPLGSQNGGGKSTLLQLIFVLLHCSFDKDKKQFLQNLLQEFKILDGEEKILAIIDIWDGEKIVKLEFFCKKFQFVEGNDPLEYEYINSEDIIYICQVENFREEIDHDYTILTITVLNCHFNNQKNEQAKLFLDRV